MQIIQYEIRSNTYFKVLVLGTLDEGVIFSSDSPNDIIKIGDYVKSQHSSIKEMHYVGFNSKIIANVKAKSVQELRKENPEYFL